MDFLYSGDLVRALSTEAGALYQHLGPAQHHLGGLLQQVFALCCNALGLSNELPSRAAIITDGILLGVLLGGVRRQL